MIIRGSNIISSLGFSTEENFRNVLAGNSGLKYCKRLFGLPEPVFASIIDRERLSDEFNAVKGLLKTCQGGEQQFTCLEMAAIVSVIDANRDANIDLDSEKTLFILSTTKGNVDLLSVDGSQKSMLWYSAEIIAHSFGNSNMPTVVSNACVSGAAAIITAIRELKSGKYDNIVVVGVDLLSRFIVSGFQSLRALAGDFCRPFDRKRCGLNLGEAAATVIISRKRNDNGDMAVNIMAGAIRNDANHISSPSRTGEGCFRAIASLYPYIKPSDDSIAFINAHGTATQYNDAMESAAIMRAGLQDIPVTSLKGYFGHTLGAAGVLESIISIRALQEGVIPATKGFESQADDCPLKIDNKTGKSGKTRFLKLISGFGGVNAALVFEKSQVSVQQNLPSPEFKILKSCSLSFTDTTQMNGYYRSMNINYPRFFKMDQLSKLGFLASETIFKDEKNRFAEREDIAVICFNSTASMDADMMYLESINPQKDYFPSPAIFVYTLPNIVTGEISIRNKFFGETGFFVLKSYDRDFMLQSIKNCISDNFTNFALCAWIDIADNHREIKMIYVEKCG
ncbi:MAG: 3-oxoacyl-ACP synthase [Dysgonamonadaceae bacterium]|jgi:3-oxoacyl-[acyl-carrier-protein] synthase-1|nr:3-oxoacyl-ACP synthase [Dysgonamonadaceae bacterium]